MGKNQVIPSFYHFQYIAVGWFVTEFISSYLIYIFFKIVFYFLN